MKKVFSVLILFVMISTLCACGSGESHDEQTLIGTWVLSEGITDLETITFYSDGTCLVDNDENGTWDIVDNVLKILGPYGGQFWDHDNIIGEYSLVGDKLIFINPVVDGSNREGQIIYYKDAQ